MIYQRERQSFISCAEISALTGLLVQIEHFVKSKLEVCRWVGLAVLLVQLISLALAYALSAAQQRLLDVRWGAYLYLKTLSGSGFQ